LKYIGRGKLVKFTRTPNFERDLDCVPEHIRVKAIVWIGLVESLGIRELRKRPGFHDEGLKGERKGQRSVRLNRSYRLIYCEVQGDLHFLLLEISKHEY